MSETRLLNGLSEIIGGFDFILCDVWGVIHNGRARFPGACDALERARAAGVKVALITNAPVPRAQVEALFPRLGVRGSAYDTIVSSGDTTRAMLAGRQGQSMYAIGADEGWERDRKLFAGLDLNLVDTPEQADFILTMGLRDGFAEHPESYRAEMQALAQLGLPMVVPNPDIQVRVGDRLHWCGGALGRIYAEYGGPVVLSGKPHPPIYARALEVLGAQSAPKDRVLCIGDGPVTDIRGANDQGFASLYVGTGLHQHRDEDFMDEAMRLLAAEDVRADFAMPRLVW